jgi:hypothetical protein
MAERGEVGYFGKICTWRGTSGQRYRFSVYALDTPVLGLAGVYVLATEGDLFTPYRALLIDACGNFARDLPGSAILATARDAGATSLHLYYSNLTNPDPWAMKRDLVERYRPALNRAPIWRMPRAADPRGVVVPFPAQRRQRA